jgi:CubicO group peptidase (beta-lactamase class C family)
MRPETGFLFGSIHQGHDDHPRTAAGFTRHARLDRPVVEYLPSFRLTTPGAAEKILVRHCSRTTAGSTPTCTSRTPPGRRRSRCTWTAWAAMRFALRAGRVRQLLQRRHDRAGRLLEAVTGVRYHDLLRRDVYGPLGMTGASVSAKEAILRSVAIGHFPSFESGDPPGRRRCSCCGHLGAGRGHADRDDSRPDRPGPDAPRRRRQRCAVGRDDRADAFRRARHGRGERAAVGLGLLLIPFGDTTVLSMSGALAGRGGGAGRGAVARPGVRGVRQTRRRPWRCTTSCCCG